MDNIVFVCVHGALIPWQCTGLFCLFAAMFHLEFLDLRRYQTTPQATDFKRIQRQQWTDFDKCRQQQFWSAVQAVDPPSADRRHMVLSSTMVNCADGWLAALKRKYKYLTHFSASFDR